MASVILSEASGTLKSLYGELQAPLASMITDYSEQFERQSVAEKIFSKRKSTHRIEGYSGITKIDSFEPVGENGAYPTGGFQEDYSQILVNTTWKGSFSISRELVEDNQIGEIGQKPYALTQDYHRKRERFFARLIGEALQGHTGFRYGADTFSTACKDGKCVFDKAHPAKVKGAAQSNLFEGAFNPDNLFALITAMSNVRDADGNIMDLGATTIVIPNVATLSKEVYQAIGSTFDPGSSNNAINVVGGQLEVIPWSYLNEFITPKTAPYIILDSNYNERYDGNIMQERIPVEYRDEVGANDEYIWKGRARFTGGFVDWRQMFVGGVTGGSSLADIA